MNTITRGLCAALLWLGLAGSALATVTARLDRTHIAQGETANLMLQTDGNSARQPDISPLLQDFEVLGSSRGSNTQIVNGQMSSQMQLTLVLSPRHMGTLRVPPLQWGNEQSAALELTVGASGAPMPSDSHAAAAEGGPVTMSAAPDQKHPYVQSAVVLTVRVELSVPVSQANLDLPGNADIRVTRVGEDVQSNIVRNGRNVQVVERKYLLVPQRSGSLELKGPVLDAQIQDGGGPDINDLFNNAFGPSALSRLMGRMRPIHLVGQTIALDVRARPPAAATPWLPAQQLTLTETWRPDHAPLHVGEPLTRHLALAATGLTGTQLPDLSTLMALPDGIKAYPDRAQTQDDIRSGSMQGSRTQDVALMASAPGQYTLPALHLQWWDTQAHTPREATLPARTLDVLPAVGGTPNPPASATPNLQAGTAPEPALAAPDPASAPAAAATPLALPTTHSALTSGPVWPWVSAVLALLWLGTGVAWWRARQARPGTGQPHPEGSVPQGATTRAAGGPHLAALKLACRHNDPQAARQSLLAWGATHWPQNPPLGLQSMAQRLAAPGAVAALLELDRACYRGDQWQGDALEQAFAAPPRQTPGEKNAPLIPDLYP